MTSLTDVYEGRAGRVASRRQQLLGTGLFLVGAVGLVGAIAVATTGLGGETLGELSAREWGGVLAGVGVQSVLLGVFAVLPASRLVRGAAVIATGIALLGVALFRHVYPYQWVEAAPLVALATVAVYFFGVVTTFWCLFVALATFKTRNDPGGTARMEITQEGTIRLVEEARSMGGLGGIGLLGTEPDGEVETQTNGPSNRGSGSSVASAALSDGGATSTDSVAEVESNGTSANASPATNRSGPDAYCGNCRHFEYVTADGEPEPYCGYHGERLDDMDACSAWSEDAS